MEQINVDKLIPHPRNNEFFDDITGDNWEAFKESIRTSGVIEPIVITKDKVIVSGHQRVRACKELGITSVLCDCRFFDNDSEDEILKVLIETNIRQRGVGNPNPVKLGRCIKELERIYGVREGSAGNAEPKVSAGNIQTQRDLANTIGISVDTLQNYKKLTDLVPELQDWIETGILAPTTALAIVKYMSPEEQDEFAQSFDGTKKITHKQTQKYIDQIKQLKENPPLPTDYEQTKQKLKNARSDYSKLHDQYQQKVNELQNLKNQIETMKATTPTEQYNQKLKDSTIFFCSRVADFIEKVGGYVWLSDHLNELPEYERNSYISAVNAVNAWSNILLENIKK